MGYKESIRFTSTNQCVSNLSNEPSKANRIWYPSFCNCRPRLAIHLNPVRVSSNKNPSRSAIVCSILDETVDAIMAAVAGFCPFFSARVHIHQPSRAPNSLPEKTFQSPLQLSQRWVKRIKRGLVARLASLPWLQFSNSQPIGIGIVG